MDEKQKFFEEFNNSLHRIGRLTMVLMIGMLMMVPVVFGLLNGLSPDWNGFVNGIIKVAIIYYPTSIVEFLIYTPMLGVGGSYLSFITGNVTNMRIPCAMNAASIAKTEPGTAELEIISTIAVATSAMVEMISCSAVPGSVFAIEAAFIAQGMRILVTLPVMKLK